MVGLAAWVLFRAHGASSDLDLDYRQEVKPVLKARCFACHGALKQKSELRLDTAAAIHRGSKNGPVILTNAVETSVLLKRLVTGDKEERMPPEGEPLTALEIEAVRRWIASGAPTPPGELQEPDPRRHWAFQQPVRPEIPEVSVPGFEIRNPIDAFLAATWRQQGMVPAPPADQSQWLRRVHVDLIGLPPTVEQRRQFLDDNRPDARERVVEQLLNSPRHGERWARHWMDVWRYADWFGRRHVPDVWNSAPQIWRWRDWIVRSLNDDKGYDRMIQEMLAGDELAPENPEITVATGFLVRNWYALNPNQWMRENVEHTAKAFLGLTLNCAHCHDHKYDPITQMDYFRFRAFFEPLGLRQDWVAGESDPGPFQKYDYSSLRKVVKHGTVQVFDEMPSAKTYIYEGGDERAFLPGKPSADPAVPAFLSHSAVPIKPVSLPTDVSYPGLKSFIREARLRDTTATMESAISALGEATRQRTMILEETARDLSSKAMSNLARAETTWLRASNRVALTRAESESIQARLDADLAVHRAGAKDTNDVVKRASQAERAVAVVKVRQKLSETRASLSLLEQEQGLAAARRSLAGLDAAKETKQQAENEALRKKLLDQLAMEEKALQAAEVALGTNSTRYTALSPIYPSQSTGRRLSLVRWMAQRDNPLVARVAVNHVWKWHFHEPLVKSVYDFGRNGAPPSHPELLDWLAVELMEHQWSLKHLHRLITSSSAYGLASMRRRTSPDRLSISNQPPVLLSDPDPDSDLENRWFSRMNVGRLESEIVRDAVLFVAGSLDLKAGGYPLENTAADTLPQRSLYFECFPEEGGHDAFTTMFDPPDPGECYRRTRTIIPQQALALSNSQFLETQSTRLAERLWNGETNQGQSVEAFISVVFERILNRSATPAELQLGFDYLGGSGGGALAKPEAAKRRISFVRALFNHNDFVSVR